MDNQAFSAICGRGKPRTGCRVEAIVMRDMQMRVRTAGVMRPSVDRELGGLRRSRMKSRAGKVSLAGI